MNATPYDLVVIEQEYRDFSVFVHGLSLTYEPFPCSGPAI